MIQQFARLSLSTQGVILSQLSDQGLPPSTRSLNKIEKIDSIFVTNFKSFNKKYIGPFLNFTCIIGPNGSGKSNILDALMFCFCSQASRHSLLDARQLINRHGKQTFKDLMKQHKTCSVQTRFILTNGQKLTLQRILNAQGQQTYLINHQRVDKTNYIKFLIKNSIIPTSPNYAIWQGQIDRLILKDPLQLTSLLEKLSGSIYYKKQYDEIKEKLQQVQEEYQMKMKKINKYKIEKKQVKNVQKNQEGLRKLEKNYNDLMWKFYNVKVLEKQSGLQLLQKQIQQTKQKQQKRIKEINQLKSVAQKSRHEKQSLQTQLHNLIQQLQQLHNTLKKIDNPANILLMQQLKNQQNHHQQLLQKLKTLQNKHQTLTKNIPQIPQSSIIQQYAQIYEKWQSENSSLNRQYIKKNNQCLYITGMLQTKKQLQQQYNKKIEKYHLKQGQVKEKVRQYEENVKSLDKSIDMVMRQQKEQKKNQEALWKEVQKKEEKYREIVGGIQDLEGIVVEQASSTKQGQLLKHLSTINNFHGILANRIKPTTSKYQIVFQNLFSPINKQLLVQNQKAARQTGDRLKQMNMMKVLVILDNINNTQGNKKNNQIRKRVGKDAMPAIDCVELDDRLVGFQGYLANYLVGKVICENIELAYRVRNRNIEGVKEIYTIDGNIVRQDGTISAHGNPQTLKKTYKYNTNQSNIYNDLSKLNKDKISIQSELRNLKMKLNDENRLSAQLTKLQQKKAQIIQNIDNIHKNPQKQPKIPKQLLQQIKQLQNKQHKQNKAIKQLQKMMKSSRLFDQFIKKHGIESLQVFRNTNNFQHIQSMMKKRSEIMKAITIIQSQINTYKSTEKNIKKKIDKLSNKISQLPHKNDKKQLQKTITQKQKQVLTLKTTLSKLPNLNNRQLLHFTSTLPSLQAKLTYTKQKIMKQLQEIADQYGVKFQYPIENQQLRKQLQLPKKRKITEDDIQRITNDLTKQKQKIQENLNKYNTMTFLRPYSQKNNAEQSIQQKIDALLAQIDQMKQYKNKKSDQLETIRKDRSLILIEFINTLKKNLEVSYRLLTEMDNGLSGTIDLHIQNFDHPFQYGVYFSPTPPTKRFIYDLEQLSGGEKSIASLSLQYSLALTTQVPFLILDETDAFLDANNVNRFLKLINHSMQNKNIQMIIVTHKHGLFSASQSLIGVSRPKLTNLSQIFSLKLIEN